MLTYGCSSNATACQSIWHYEGGPLKLFGFNIGQPARGSTWCYFGWTYYVGDNIAADDTIQGSSGATIYLRPVKTTDALNSGSPSDGEGHRFVAHPADSAVRSGSYFAGSVQPLPRALMRLTQAASRAPCSSTAFRSWVSASVCAVATSR